MPVTFPYAPGRPPSAKDLELMMNGQPVFLGILTSASTTAPVNNSTTATPFRRGRLLADGVTRDLRESLAGMVLMVQPTLAGLFLASPSAQISVPTVSTVALQSVIPPAAATEPGVLLQAQERVFITMLPDYGWLQWLSNSASSSSLLVWGMV